MSRNADSSSSAIRQLELMDPLLQHPTRLGACVLLASVDALSFTRLRELLNETDGNLGAQLRKLEDDGYVTINKTYEGRRPVTWYYLSPVGAKALKRHLNAIDALHRSIRAK